MKKLILSLTFLACSLLSYNSLAQITFSSNFECGSMDKAELICSSVNGPTEKYEYNFYSKLDPLNAASPKLAPSGRWFYFKMSGIKGKEITLNFKNTDPLRCVYSYDNVNWVRFAPEEAPERCKVIKKYDNDEVYIAYYIPYTYTHLNSKIYEWTKNDWVDFRILGKSEHGRNVPMLTITSRNGGKPISERKVVYIHGRVHPSETPGSWHLEGMIDILASDTPYAKHLRDNAVFYIVPFTNPDGVVEGMSRSNGEGINLEVNWNDPEEVTSQEVKNLRNLVENFVGIKNDMGLPTAGMGVDVFLNMHSQVANFVTYWVHKAEGTSDKYFKELMLLCNLTINNNPYFGKDGLCFSKVSPRYLEGWFWDKAAEKTVAITFETPYTFYNKNSQGEWLTVENLKKMSWNNVWATADYLGIGAPERTVVAEPTKVSKFTTHTDNGHFYFGNSYLVAKEEGAKVKFKVKNLPAGEYNIYKWRVGECKNISDKGENEWGEPIGKLVKEKKGSAKVEVTAEKAGDKVDNILLVKVK